MNQFDAIVIGGGLGGLITGAQLAKKGKKILLLERHYIPGGCATVFKRKDVVMEVGLHEMDGLHPHDLKTRLFHDLGIFENLKFIRLPEFFRAVSPNHDVTIPDDTEKAIDVLTQKFPEEAKGIKKYFKVIHKIRSEVERLPAKNWKVLLLFPFFPVFFPYLTVSTNIVTYLLALTNPLFLLLSPRLLLWRHRTIGSLLDSCTKNEDLKKILLSNLAYYHNDPYSMSLIYYSVAQGNYYKGSYFIRGGSQKLSNYLSSMITDHGGSVLLGKKVEQILVKDRHAVGVVYKDAFNDRLPSAKVFADTVVGNAAIPLIADMLPDKHRAFMKSKIDSLEEACSLLSVYIAFKTEIKNLGNPSYSTIVEGHNVNTIRDIEPDTRDRWENKGFIFVDYSQVDSGLAPKGKSFGVLGAVDYLAEWESLDPETYQAKKEKIAQTLFKRLEKVIPGVTEQIAYYTVATPKTIKRYTSNPKGSPYGYAQLPRQAGIYRRRSFTDVKGLYFASAWAFPGGGFTGAIISGMQCAQALKDKPSKNISEGRIKDSRIVPLVEKRDIAENTIELRFEKPQNMDFEAGQYAVLDLMKMDNRAIDIPIRPLSIVSHPDEKTVCFAMRLSQSRFKQDINGLKTGDCVRIFGPMGDFTLDATKKGIVFLIAGIGVTPVVPMLKELGKKNFDRPVHLFYSNKTESQAAYHRYFQSVNLPSFNYHPVFTASESRIDDKRLKTELGELTPFDYYVVGTSGFLRAMKNMLYANKVTSESVKVDDFG